MWLYYKFSLHHSYNHFLKGWENTLFELRSERVNAFIPKMAVGTQFHCTRSTSALRIGKKINCISHLDQNVVTSVEVLVTRATMYVGHICDHYYSQLCKPCACTVVPRWEHLHITYLDKREFQHLICFLSRYVSIAIQVIDIKADCM